MKDMIRFTRSGAQRDTYLVYRDVTVPNMADRTVTKDDAGEIVSVGYGAKTVTQFLGYVYKNRSRSPRTHREASRWFWTCTETHEDPTPHGHGTRDQATKRLIAHVEDRGCKIERKAASR